MILDFLQALEVLLDGFYGPFIGTARASSLQDGGAWLMKQDMVLFPRTAGLTILLDSQCIL